jgi:hypothetical protein
MIKEGDGMSDQTIVAARTVAAVLWLVLAISGCGGGGADPVPAPDGGGGGTGTARVPLADLVTGNYLGFSGGLYPNGANSPPSAHRALGLARAQAVRPLDTGGNPSPAGKIVLLSIGMSNTTQEFCSADSSVMPCSAWSFMGQAAADAAVNKTTLAIVNGARSGQTAPDWDSPADSNYDRIRDTRLAPQGLTEQQVQVAWVKVANAGPSVSLPSTQADAYALLTSMGGIVRALKQRYPNLQQVFLSSRIYAGYATTPLNPEPYAYESGFAVKWLVQAQIDQAQSGGTLVDARAGNLDPTSVAPWLAWGAYLWADGLSPRSDGLLWERADLEADGTHPAQLGEAKVAAQLLGFFKNSEFSRCWFVAGGSCP